MKKNTMILIAMRLLALLGLGICVYLLYFSLGQDGQIPGCLPGSGCDTVLQSHWSRLFGWPVALPGAAIYILINAALLHIGSGASAKNFKQSQTVLLVLLTASALIACWFIYVQKVLLGSFCVYCTTLHGISLVLCVLAWIQFHKHQQAGKSNRGTAYCLLVVLGGLLAGSCFIAIQLLLPTQDTTTTTTLENHVDQQLVGPTVGSSHAKFSIIHVYDYTCIHCKQMHFLLKDLVKRYQGQIAIFAMPAPFDATCNPAYTSTDPVNQNGCELAKIALRVWIAAPDQFEKFDDWLIRPLNTASPGQAIDYARKLVGPEKFDKTANDPLPAQILKYNIALKNSKLSPQLPNVIIGQKVVTGTPDNTNIFEQYIQNQWQLSPEPAYHTTEE